MPNSSDKIDFIEYELPAVDEGEYVLDGIPFTLTLVEDNRILDALGDRPFGDVYDLVEKIQQQVQPQLDADGLVPDEFELALPVVEVDRVLEALGQRPFVDVVDLVEKLQTLAATSLDG